MHIEIYIYHFVYYCILKCVILCVILCNDKLRCYNLVAWKLSIRMSIPTEDLAEFSKAQDAARIVQHGSALQLFLQIEGFFCPKMRGPGCLGSSKMIEGPNMKNMWPWISNCYKIAEHRRTRRPDPLRGHRQDRRQVWIHKGHLADLPRNKSSPNSSSKA